MATMPSATPRHDSPLAVASGCWGYAESRWLGGWLLRATGGFTTRANSVMPLGDPGVPLDEALREAGDWYAARELPTLVQVVIDSPLDEQLARLALAARHGSTAIRPALQQTASVCDALGALDASIPTRTAPPVVLSEAPSAAWLGRYRDGAALATAEHARHALEQGGHVRFATIIDPASGDHAMPALAIGRACLVDGNGRRVAATDPAAPGETRWAGIGAVEVAPSARRRGLARVIMRALLGWAAEHGATQVCLEVTPNNAPALALYRALMFTTARAYHYRMVTIG